MSMSQSITFSILRFCAFICFSALGGCTDETRDNSSDLAIVPSEIQLGQIAASGQEIDTIVSVRNLSDHEMSIQIQPSCGCIITDGNDFKLPKGGVREVCCKLSSYGRTGSFYAELLIVCDGHSNKVPISAIFLPQVFAIPSRVALLSETSSTKASGEFQLQVSDELWNKCVFEFNHAEIDIAELEQRDSLRRFKVTSLQKLSHFQPIVLRISGQSAPVLSIPVIGTER